MLVRFLSLFFIILPLYLNAESVFSAKMEVGLFLPEIKGTIENTQGTSDFEDDYKYETSEVSFFSLDIDIHKDYIPSISISYLNMTTNMNSDLNKSVTVADGNFSSAISTRIDYSMINAIIYKDFVKKGTIFTIFGKPFYTGDLELDIGVNVKIVKWNFEIEDKIDLTKPISWINAGLIVPLPHLALRYYVYDFSFYSEVSALSMSDAKLMSYQMGIDYRIVNSIYLNGSYLYEHFEAVEENDTIGFTTAGYKFSFKYIF